MKVQGSVIDDPVGGRFWWEREGVFTSAQRTSLKAVSLSRLICDNSHISHVPADPFSLTVRPEDMLACSHPLIPQLDLSAWKEPDSGREGSADTDRWRFDSGEGPDKVEDGRRA